MNDSTIQVLLTESPGFLAAIAVVVFAVGIIIPALVRSTRRIPFAGATNIITLYAVTGIIFCVFGEIIDQPHVVDGWLLQAFEESFIYNLWSWVTVALLIAIDALAHPRRKEDVQYFPEPAASLRAMKSLLPATITIAPAFLYYGFTVAELMPIHSSPHGNLFPPPRIFISCWLLWATLWAVESWRRPEKQTFVCALGFFVLTAFFSVSAGFGILVE
jgi:hypothetical protein